MSKSRGQHIEALLEDLQVLKQKIFLGAVCQWQTGQITPSQWLVLHYLKKNEGASFKDLAQTLNVTSSAVTQLITPLLRQKYVIKEINVLDRRESRLLLSQKSQQELASAHQQHIKKMQHIFAALSDEELDCLRSLFKKMTGN